LPQALRDDLMSEVADESGVDMGLSRTTPYPI
jgi:hypothetical protein